MPQVNIRIDSETDKFLSYLCEMENKSKSTISKEIFMKGIEIQIFPYFAQQYKSGNISIHQIATLLNKSHLEIMDKIAELIEDIYISEDLIDYSQKIGQKMHPLFQDAKKRKISFKGTINPPQK